MLHLTGRVALGMDIADFLELEGPLHGNWIVNAPAQENDILGITEQMGQLGATAVVVLHKRLQLGRQFP